MKWEITKTKDRRVAEHPVDMWTVHREPGCCAVCCYDEGLAKLVCEALNEKAVQP